ncbi:SMI1/KNR4 family protein [Thermomonas haemolytica]|uniref:SMI1/KNR4 family protein n=1 Tax=Thermomonas haemolytica TaxID=141949 RepID=UPI00104A7701|nr:SMI1/KNR4 family protein [Thermomonas haemolytica]
MVSRSFIESLGPELGPLKKLLARTGNEVVISGSDVLVSHRPEIGPEAYAITLHAPQTDSELAVYETTHGLAIPASYVSVLRSINGGRIFDLSLYGAPRSMRGSPPLLDRSSRQPQDLATANRFWRVGFQAAPELFHFGGAALSVDENVGYFIDASGSVVGMRKGGTEWRRWATFSAFLSAEIDRLEQSFPAFEAFMADTARTAR